MKTFRKIAILLLCVIILFPNFLKSQSQSGFYDEYDMDLRNLPPGANEDRFQNYPVPPKKKNNFAVSPKKIRRFYDPLASFPGAGTGSLEQLGNQGAGVNQNTPQQGQNSFINPITGDINYDAALGNLNNQDRERERKEKDKKRFIEEETYKESKFRRFQIVFFLTLPAALGVSAGVAGLLGIEKAITGSILMISGSVGLSSANAYNDLQNLEKHKKEHGTEWHDEDDEVASSEK